MRNKILPDLNFVSSSQIESKFNYYNIHTGYWEPFIEGLNIEFMYDKQMNSRVIQLIGKESIDLNISRDFVGVLSY
jgi:hypothetical protein